MKMILLAYPFGVTSMRGRIGYGEKRIIRLRAFIDALTKFGIDFDEVIRKYAQIDAYSQKKLNPSAPFTARNMGKNDIWIAATASAFDLVLLTTDQDFAHLEGTCLKLAYVPLTGSSCNLRLLPRYVITLDLPLPILPCAISPPSSSFCSVLRRRR